MKILLATHNVHKLREFREMFKSLKGIDAYSLLDFPNYVPPEESGSTFQENAVIKAVHAASHLKYLAVADDSGLVVPALKGLPGVRSRRFSSEDATDQENNRKLLEMMMPLREDERGAYYECTLAIANPDGLITTLSSKVEGTIIYEERGRSGFGYDSVFKKHEYEGTFGELNEAIKNRISHRRKAFDKLALKLEQMMLNSCTTS